MIVSALLVWFMVINGTLNNISIISWRSVLLALVHAIIMSVLIIIIFNSCSYWGDLSLSLFPLSTLKWTCLSDLQPPGYTMRMKNMLKKKDLIKKKYILKCWVDVPFLFSIIPFVYTAMTTYTQYNIMW
jgi:hypothetical protein